MYLPVSAAQEANQLAHRSKNNMLKVESIQEEYPSGSAERLAVSGAETNTFIRGCDSQATIESFHRKASEIRREI